MSRLRSSAAATRLHNCVNTHAQTQQSIEKDIHKPITENGEKEEKRTKKKKEEKRTKKEEKTTTRLHTDLRGHIEAIGDVDVLDPQAFLMRHLVHELLHRPCGQCAPISKSVSLSALKRET